MQNVEETYPLDISVVIPVYQEEGSVQELASRLIEVLDRTGRSFEILFVDDGSSDDTLRILRAASAKDDRIKIVSFRRNFGQTAALAAGFDYARGGIVVTLDGDLQNDPEDIPRLVEKVEEEEPMAAPVPSIVAPSKIFSSGKIGKGQMDVLDDDFFDL